MATKKQAAPQADPQPEVAPSGYYFRAKVGGVVVKFVNEVDASSTRAQSSDYEEVTEADYEAYRAAHAAALSAQNKEQA